MREFEYWGVPGPDLTVTSVARNGERRIGLRQQHAFSGDDCRLHAGRADVDAQKHA